MAVNRRRRRPQAQSRTRPRHHPQRQAQPQLRPRASTQRQPWQQAPGTATDAATATAFHGLIRGARHNRNLTHGVSHVWPGGRTATAAWRSFRTSRGQRERIRENVEKVKLNKQLPYLVGNVVKILEPDAVEGLDAEEGGG